MMLAKIALCTGGAILFAGAWVVHEGAIRVSVDEAGPRKDAAHVHLLLPAALAPMSVHLLPQNLLGDGLEQARPWLPVAEVACQQLAQYPDAELVEVRDGHEHVRVATHGGNFYIDVEDVDETVHVSFPLRTAWKVVRTLEESGPTI